MASGVPKRMKGISIPKTGGVEVLEYRDDLPTPEPKEGEMLVKNDFVGVNYIDTYFRTGLYPAPSFPYILGREAAGTVVSHGPSCPQGTPPVNSRVAYIGQCTYAEYTVAPVAKTLPLPDPISNEIGCAMMIQGLTGLTLIREAHAVKKGDWVLVHAAAGGTGLWLCQLLHATGAHVIGTSSTPEKKELAKKAGAEVVLDYPEKLGGPEAFVAKVKELTHGEGCPAVFDGVGAATFDVSLQCVARKGTMVSFGNASGAVPPFAVSRLSAQNAKVVRPTLFHYITTKEEWAKYSGELKEMVTEGKVDVRVHKVFGLDEAAKAHQEIEGRKTTGKILLKP